MPGITIVRMNKEKAKAESKTEHLARFGRNFNALGAVALGGLALAIPGPNVIIAGLAGINAAQAGGFELWRQHTKTKCVKKK